MDKGISGEDQGGGGRVENKERSSITFYHSGSRRKKVVSYTHLEKKCKFSSSQKRDHLEEPEIDPARATRQQQQT